MQRGPHTLNGLAKSSLLQEIRINLSISANGDAQPYVGLFNPKSQLWEDNFAAKFSTLGLATYEEGNQTWEADLLYSIQNLRHLNMEGGIPNSTWRELSWPLLCDMELRDLSSPSDSFVAFIMRHNATLSDIALVNVEALDGTWEEPLQKVIETKQLRHLHLLNLYQTASSVTVPNSFELPFAEMESEVVLIGRDDIAIAADAFRYHFWTTVNVPNDGRYVVDL